MEPIKTLLEAMSQHLTQMAKGNAVVAKPVSVGDRSIIPLCELSLSIGGGGGMGESEGEPGQDQASPDKGTGGGAGGSAKALPLAVIVVDGDDVRLERLG